MTSAVRILLLGFTALTPGLALAQALPSGGSFAAGSGNIASAGTATTVTQSTARGVINWQSFSIASGHSVQFENGSGATLNRVTGAQMSELQGHLGATGSLYLINPNGVVIGPNGSVATGGSFVASTRDASDSAFMQGKSLTLSGTSSGTVKNEGKITSTNGNVVLVGQSVSNSGTVSAANGTVALAAGNKVILSEAEGPDGIYIETDADAKGDVTNTGHIQAAAARLAAAGGNVYALAGNRDGLIQATGTSSVNGQVFLTAPYGIVTVEDTTVAASTQDGTGGTIRANGREVSLGSHAVLDASATQSGKRGGQVLVGTDAMGGVNLAARTTLASGATLKARGKDNGAGGEIETSAHTMDLGNATIDAGVGGQWLLDPEDLTIDTAAANTINATLAKGTNVTQQTNADYVNNDAIGVRSSGNGDIILNAPISWSTSSKLTLNAYHSITLNAGITITGDGTLALVTNYNNASATSSGVLTLNGSAIQFPNRNNTANTGGTLTINDHAYTLITNTDELQAVGASGYYALALPIGYTDASRFTPLGGTSGFSGDFNGLGNTISYLTVVSSAADVGLFGRLAPGSTLENIGILSGSIRGRTSGDGSSVSVGGLVGTNNGGSIVNAYVTGSVSYLASNNRLNLSLGGLVGTNNGTIAVSYATGPVSYSGTSATSVLSAGGLIGTNSNGSVTDVYSTGSVINSGSIDTLHLGGLIGTLGGGSLANAYATGNVSGTDSDALSSFGGLVGYRGANDTITNVFWDVDTTGQSEGVGQGSDTDLTGKSTADSQAALPAGFDSAVWGNAGNQTTPYLRSLSGNQVFSVNDTTANLYTVVLNTSQLQAVQNNLGGRYVLGKVIDAATFLGFAPIAGTGTEFTGVLDGLGYTVNNLVISSGADYVGLIGRLGSGGVVRNIGTQGGSVSGTLDNGVVGGLVGSNHGSIISAYATGAVSGSGAQSTIGGLVGSNGYDGTISTSYATGGVSGTGTGAAIGGLAGYNDGAITNAYATGAVSELDRDSYVGGLIGYNDADSIVSNVYATGAVTGSSENQNIGGLAGANPFALNSDGSVNDQVSGKFINTYWDTSTTRQESGVGSGDGAGVTGLTTSQLQAALPAGFTNAVWGNADNRTTPYLLGLSGNRVFSANDPSANLYTVIMNTAQLQGMQNNLSDRYVLGNTIEASGYTGFVPIGSGSKFFSGTLDGLGYTINNLVISSTSRYTGLIGRLLSGGIVTNIGMLGGSVTGTGTVVGGLVGSNSGGTISNAYVTGSVSSIATFIITDTDPDSVEGAIVGGLVGDNYGTISNAYSTGAVSSILRVIGADPALGPRAISSAGGIAGINGGIINNVYATGTVSTTVSGASVQNALGGLVGNNYCGSLTDVYATGNVSATGNGNGFYVGGLVGSNIMGNITNARATGAVLLRDDQGAVGGLVGINQNATISNTYATGTVSAVGENNYVGGLVGDNEQYSNENSTVITDSYATGAISAGDKGTVGGLVGMTDSTSSISNAYATGAISAGTDSLVGGLIGSNNGAVTNAYWDTTTTGVAQAVGDGSSMGITGLTTVQWLLGGADSLIELPAWVAGAPYPVLSALPYIVIKAEGAQVYGSNGLNISGVTFTDQNGAEASSRMSGAIAWQNVILSSTNSAGSTGILYGTGMTASGYQIVYRALNTITPAELIVMAANQSGTYGQSPVLDNAAFAVSGIVNGDKVTGVTLATDAKAESPAGLYALTISKAIGTGLGNYSISYRPALYEVEASASVAPEPVPSTPDTSMTIVPEPVPSVPDTSTAVVPEPVPPVPDTLMPVSPIPTTPILTPAAAAVAFSQVFWPTPVTSPTSVSFSSPVLSSMQTSDESDEADESENVASVASLKAMYAKNQMLGAEGGLAYRIISLLPALSNQLRKIQ